MGDTTFVVGTIVEHKLTGEKLMVLKKGKEQYECRKVDNTTAYFYDFEIKVLN